MIGGHIIKYSLGALIWALILPQQLCSQVKYVPPLNTYQCGYDPATRTWYINHKSSIKNRLLYERYQADSGVMTGGSQLSLPYNRTIIPFQGNLIWYGLGHNIEGPGQAIDSIPQADSIVSLYSQDTSLTWAVIQNRGTNYLFQRKMGKWTLNPIVTSEADSLFTIKKLQPWVLLIAGLALFFFIYSLQRRRSAIDSAIADLTEQNPLFTKSEKPLGLESEDLLGFAALEDTMLNIMKNPQTDLPVTIVVSGNWGSGKSSMMNRVREKLDSDPKLKNRFMTTWFNAWHLQGEPSLLNSFLLNIIACYERYFAPYSAFRLRIAFSRFTSQPLWKQIGFGAALAVIGPFIALGLLVVIHKDRPTNTAFLSRYCEIISHIFFSGSASSATDILTPVGAALLILGSLLFVNKQFVPTGLSAFFELLPKNNFKLDVESAEIGSREKFRQQYWEIMAAAREGTRLVVFIDDLDRIPGDKILEILEGINFISDIASRPQGVERKTPNTVFVLGMYTQEVARLVGTQLGKVNDSVLPVETLGSLYVEKMVQLIVPVPFDSDDKNKLKKLYEN